MYTDGSVIKDQSGWGFTVKQGVTTIPEGCAAYTVSTSSLTVDVEAVTHTFCWTASRGESLTMHAIILTDSVSLLQKAEWETQTGLSPSLISLMVSVDVKHHVYLLTYFTQTGMCQWSTATFENSCGCTVLDMPE